MKRIFILASLILILLTITTNVSLAQNSIKLKFFSPRVQSPPTSSNAECTNDLAEQVIQRYEDAGLLATEENASRGLLACDVYRYLNGCTGASDNCTRPCIYIINGPSAEEILAAPGVEDNINDFHAMTTTLFRKYWIYAKGIGRFDLRNGFGLTDEGKSEAQATLGSMTCAERSSALSHHIETPLYFYPQIETKLSITIPNYKTTEIISHPDGTFTHEDQKYSAFYYDLSSSSFTKPSSGKIIDGFKLSSELSDIVRQLQFTHQESSDFISYWSEKLPRSPYYFVSLLTEKEAKNLANWKIFPSPDTEIRYIFYFRPLVQKPKDSAFSYTFSPKSRAGFTVLDWGGVVDW